MRVLLLLAMLSVIDVRTSDACATAPPPGAEVQIAEEEALIVWDPATKTEQFIRRAAFRSTARQFGFLVPTPATPKLTEVSDGIFASLTALVTPPVRYDRPNRYQAGSWLVEGCMLTKGASKDEALMTSAGAHDVRILQTANVAGFDATTVEADDAKALTEWLGNHGFEVTPVLTTWLERYVADHWKITAFVVGTDQQGRDQWELATRAVNMTFPTDKPFYPYREPKLDMEVKANVKIAPASRVLRVFLFSTERYAATLGNEPWSAKVLQANTVKDPAIDLATLLGAADRYMTVFVDESNPRRGIEELYFTPSTDKQDVVQPTQVVVYPRDITIPIDLIVIAGLIAFWIVRRVRRKKR